VGTCSNIQLIGVGGGTVGGQIVELACSSTEDAESDESVERLCFLSVRIIVPVSTRTALLEARAGRCPQGRLGSEGCLAAPPASGLAAFGSPRLSGMAAG